MAPRAGAVYDTFLKANMPPEEAGKAAEDVGGYDDRLGRKEGRLLLLQWMLATNLAVSLLVLGLLLRG